MQDVAYTLEQAFDTSAVMTGFFYLTCWLAGRKPTNGEFLLIFAIGFAAGSLIEGALPVVSIWVFLISCCKSSLLRPPSQKH